MALFAYTALTDFGSELSGKEEAADLNDARQALQARGLRVLAIAKAKSEGRFFGENSVGDWFASQRSVSTGAMIFFFRQMAFMLRAGLPVVEALELALVQTANARLKLTLRKMLVEIKSGKSLSQAMKQHSSVFSNMAINLMVAGESTGELEDSMERLAIHMEKKAAIRAQMINSMIYPSVVILVAIGVAAFMVVKIIPKFSKFIEGKGRALPPSTQALLDISAFLRENGLFILIGLIAFIIILLAMYQTKWGRFVVDTVILRLPVLGKINVTGAMAQMTWALSTLLKSGVTIFDGLKITGELMGNQVYRQKFEEASKQIINGRDLASSIQHPKIPIMVTQMVAVGERTGSLDRVLNQMGVYYEKRLETAVKRLSAMIEPAMILLIGVMVGFVYYAFFQAMFSLISG